MQIKTIKVGELRTNCYIILDEESKQSIVVDPGDETEKILPAIISTQVLYIILTHGHYDHYGAIAALKKITKATVLMHAGDNAFYRADRNMSDGGKIRCGNITLEVLHTPGHSEGSICLYTKGYLFSGDTLFAGTYGRTDLPGSSEEKMQQSLDKLAQLPPVTQVLPGHGYATTIAREKEAGTLA